MDQSKRWQRRGEFLFALGTIALLAGVASFDHRLALIVGGAVAVAGGLLAVAAHS